MGTVERRGREREKVRKQILDAARELFARDGYERVTMRAVAEAIEYSPTTIYNHFEDKEDLVEALCQEDFARLFAALTAGPLTEDSIERIRQMGRAYARFALNLPNHYRFMFMTAKNPDHEMRPDMPGWRSFELLLDACREGVARGHLGGDSPEAMAQVLWASLHGAAALLVTYRPDQFPCVPAVPDLIEKTCENALRGWLAR
ncbi:MAG TPA: TetR/AcrR family transcriptional regulator [Vicinamibacteria bacterium]|nr:TetR/AcrR family transcriptional regulator [Vicinamibacteria bacterium]